MGSHATERNELQTMAYIVFLPSSKEIWRNPLEVSSDEYVSE